MGRIRDLAAFDKMKEDCLEAKCFLKNGIIMEITHLYGEAFDKGGYDLNLKKKAVHNTMEPYLEKYGVGESEFAYCLIEILKKAYGNKGVRPFQEFKCKINGETFTAYIILGKIKNKKPTKNNDTIMIGIYEALDDEKKELMDYLKESAMKVEI